MVSITIYDVLYLLCKCTTLLCARTPSITMKRSIEICHLKRQRKHLWTVPSFNQCFTNDNISGIFSIAICCFTALSLKSSFVRSQYKFNLKTTEAFVKKKWNYVQWKTCMDSVIDNIWYFVRISHLEIGCNSYFKSDSQHPVNIAKSTAFILILKINI